MKLAKGLMVSSELYTDYIYSALILRQYEASKQLCEILNIFNRDKFSFLYGITCILLENNTSTQKIIKSHDFIEGFRNELKKTGHDFYSLNTKLNFNSENFIHEIYCEMSKDNSLIMKIFTNAVIKLRSLSEIYKIISEYHETVIQLKSIKTEELKNIFPQNTMFFGSPALDLEIGNIMLIRSEYNCAKAHIERAFLNNPYVPDGHDQYSTVLWHLNEKELLFSLYLKLKKQFPKSRHYYITKGNYYSFTGANEKAIYYFRKALEVENKTFYALFLEGHDWLSLNNFDEAEHAFEKLYRLEKDSYQSYFGLGIVNYKKKHYDRSLKYLELASSLNPFNFNIICYISIVLESLGQKMASLDVLLKAEEKTSPTAVVYYRKAKLYEALELFDEAEKTLKIAVEKYPNDAALFFIYAEIQHKRGKDSIAVKLLKRANELDLTNPAAKNFINNIGF